MAQILPHLMELRKLLSLEYSPVEEVVERAGLAPRLIDLLGAQNDEIQIEATWYEESYVIRSQTMIGRVGRRCLCVGFCSVVLGGAVVVSLCELSTGNPGYHMPIPTYANVQTRLSLLVRVYSSSQQTHLPTHTL